MARKYPQNELLLSLCQPYDQGQTDLDYGSQLQSDLGNRATEGDAHWASEVNGPGQART